MFSRVPIIYSITVTLVHPSDIQAMRPLSLSQLPRGIQLKFPKVSVCSIKSYVYRSQCYNDNANSRRQACITVGLLGLSDLSRNAVILLWTFHTRCVEIANKLKFVNLLSETSHMFAGEACTKKGKGIITIGARGKILRRAEVEQNVLHDCRHGNCVLSMQTNGRSLYIQSF
jgi:hypothetical protein